MNQEMQFNQSPYTNEFIANVDTTSDPDLDYSPRSTNWRAEAMLDLQMMADKFFAEDKTEPETDEKYARVLVDPMKQQEDDVIFTRYLYSKEEVKQSIMVAMLNHQHDETLFWVYELYHSGYHKETFMFLMTLYIEYYVYTNMRLLIFLQTLYNYWLQNLDNYWIVGTIARTMSGRSHKIDKFVHIFYNSKYEDENNAPFMCRQKANIYLKADSVAKYDTQVAEPGQARHFLKKVCRFPIHKEIAYIFGTSVKNFTDCYRYHWEYYAYRCPLWKERILRFGGVVNHARRTVEFPDDDLGEEFYTLFGYEPDEQSLETQQKSIGNRKNVLRSTEIEFSNEYIDMSGNCTRKAVRISLDDGLSKLKQNGSSSTTTSSTSTSSSSSSSTTTSSNSNNPFMGGIYDHSGKGHQNASP